MNSVAGEKQRTQPSESFLLKSAIAGVVGACVSSLLNGFDVTKVRMQNQPANNRKYTGLIPGMRLIFKEEGFAGLTKGIYPSILRELTYSSVRIGGYEPIRKFIASSFNNGQVAENADTNPLIKFTAALLTGGMGSALCNPFDLAKTAFQAELPASVIASTANNASVTATSTVNSTGASTTSATNAATTPKGVLKYRTTWAFLNSVYKENGVKGLYKGWVATSSRAAVLTSAQLGSYDTIKNNVLKKRLGLAE